MLDVIIKELPVQVTQIREFTFKKYYLSDLVLRNPWLRTAKCEQLKPSGKIVKLSQTKDNILNTCPYGNDELLIDVASSEIDGNRVLILCYTNPGALYVHTYVIAHVPENECITLVDSSELRRINRLSAGHSFSNGERSSKLAFVCINPKSDHFSGLTFCYDPVYKVLVLDSGVGHIDFYICTNFALASKNVSDVVRFGIHPTLTKIDDDCIDEYFCISLK